MSTGEAVQLVIQAKSTVKWDEIFLLERGNAVMIHQLAVQLIELVPEHEIPICYTGLRPSEKLYNELLIDAKLQLLPHNFLFTVLKDLSLTPNFSL